MFERFFPDAYLDSAYVVNYEKLYQEGYRGILFDIDNTLVPHGAPADPEAVRLFQQLRDIGFSCCLVSNNRKKRVEPFAASVGAQFIEMAAKHDRRRLMDIGRASSSIPVVSPMVEIDGVPYLDGGIADSIPLIHAMEKGYRKNVVILTRNMGYRKKKPGKSTPLYVAAFRHYPEFLNTLYNRYRSYNRTLELLEKWEREGHIFVIRPEIPTVGRAEANKEKLMAFYQHGYDVMKDHYEELQAYLSR